GHDGATEGVAPSAAWTRRRDGACELVHRQWARDDPRRRNEHLCFGNAAMHGGQTRHFFSITDPAFTHGDVGTTRVGHQPANNARSDAAAVDGYGRSAHAVGRENSPDV